MFRKVAIALVAASVFTAPVLAQEVAPGTAKAPATTAVAPATKDVKADKAPTKHHRVVCHHRHGTKVVKHFNHGKYAHHIKRSKTATKQVSGKPVVAKQVSTKPVAKSGVN
jgi:hypothetical protein